jgi:hypothetical protein
MPGASDGTAAPRRARKLPAGEAFGAPDERRQRQSRRAERLATRRPGGIDGKAARGKAGTGGRGRKRGR